ncbi:MAG TPA: MFS transporter [Rhizomicrobium sp.]
MTHDMTGSAIKDTTLEQHSSDDRVLSSAIRRAAWRLIPFVALGYFINFMDRSGAAFAALQMNSELGLTATQFGWAGSVFFIAYTIFEVPSNLALHRFGARRWIARIMITWGIAACANALAVGPNSYYAIRFLLGAFEAGFFPGVILFLTLWFPAQYRTRMLALFAVAAPVSQLFSAPISVGLLEMHGLLGLAGWQWMFLVEGLPAILLGIAALWVLSDSPEKARWMPENERRALAGALAAERLDRPRHRAWEGFTDLRVWVLSGITFCFTIGSTGLGLWLPLILKGHDLSNLMIGALSMIPYFVGAIATLAFARYVDRTGRRVFGLALTLVLGLLGMVLSTRFTALSPALFSLTLAITGIVTARTVFYTIPQRFLAGGAAASGLALINSVGSIGGIVGPVTIGWLKDWTGSYQAGLLAMSVVLVAALALTWVVGRMLRDRAA